MSDPRCPDCGGKVSATADYCMHCSAEFEAPVDADADDERATDGADTVTVSDAAGTMIGGTGDESGRTGTEAADDARGGPAVGAGRDRSTGFGALRSGLETAVATLLAPLTVLLNRSETLVWTVVLGASLLAFFFVGANFPGTWFPAYSAAAVVGVALAVYVGGQTHADQVLAAAALGSGAVVLGTRLVGLAGAAVGEGPAAAATRLSTVYPSVVLGVALLSIGFLLRDR